MSKSNNNRKSKIPWDAPVSTMVKPVDTVLRSEHTIREEMTALRARSISNEIIYFYVVDSQDKLIGVIPTRTLLLSQSEALVSDVMNPKVISLREDATIGEAMELFASQRLLAIPVVDKEGKLLGILDVRHNSRVAFDMEESLRSVELFQMVGLQVEQFKQSSAFAGFRLRMPWLFCNITGGIACALIGTLFKETVEKTVMLAMFIPLVLTLSEAVSIQAMSICLQQIHAAKFTWGTVYSRLMNEFGAVFMLGVFCALFVGGAACLWTTDLPFVSSIGISIGISMMCAGMIGSSMPLILHLLKLDPKVAAGPIVLMATDVIATFLYLGLATLLILKVV